jgi:hypothetical protein
MVFYVPNTSDNHDESADTIRDRKFIESIGAPMCLDTTQDDSQELFLLPNFVSTEGGLDFLAALAHEKAHEDRKNFLKGKAKKFDDPAKEIIFQEFFAMLEQWRTYQSATSSELKSIKNPKLLNAFVASTENQNQTGKTSMAFLNSGIEYQHSAAARALFHAFYHGLGQAAINEPIIRHIVGE